MKFNLTDYKYIFIIIILLFIIYFFALPFAYETYNGNIDKTDCIAQVDSIKCNDNQKICIYNCTAINNSVSTITIRQP